MCMDYLTRILSYISELDEYKFFTVCRSLKLNHLSFADDLLMFCKGEAKSAYLLLQGLKLFSETTCLQANRQKSAIYCTAMEASEIERIEQFSGFKREQLPFRYLGVPISPKKLNVVDCDLLVEKMTRNIKWEDLCRSKKAGGVGFRNITIWNKAAVAKLVWHIGCQKDDLWVKWVHSFYVKGRNWWDFPAPPGASWVLKYLCKVKNDLHQLDMANWSMMNQVYSIKKVYTDMRESIREVTWASGVWNRMNLPKHKFILWLGIQGRLKTKDTLFLHGISPDNTCCICGNAGETHDHLFFGCEFSKQILYARLDWTGIPCRPRHYSNG
ncbi:uncharacterized protein LOC130591055 [Beta vulgaris subsp. vulgaris]|uniref:uncharacterized protein LOC130591055 n=1 Tax=Beta vulgaris subsp. vulgaris TaxID=3555 RepID=UPI0025465FAE|nr:uncharacterized protein LOC130591055 [Beta vulgaris subsp. vulgaris]